MKSIDEAKQAIEYLDNMIERAELLSAYIEKAPQDIRQGYIEDKEDAEIDCYYLKNQIKKADRFMNEVVDCLFCAQEDVRAFIEAVQEADKQGLIPKEEI